MALTRADLISREQFLQELARVDHAGEFAAELFYRGQLSAMTPGSISYELVADMYDQEQQHCAFFSKMLLEQGISPTMLLPLWRCLAYYLGYFSMLLGDQYGMLCTVAIEEIVDDLYGEQLRFLHMLDEPDLLEKIKDFRCNEIAHKEAAMSSGYTNGVLGDLLSKIVHTGCRYAINFSKKL